MSRVLYDPWAHAAELGIPVIVRPLRMSHGLWLPDYRTILLADHLRPWAHRVILAHELGHAALGHRNDPPENEWAADRYAAHHLLDTASVATAMCRYPNNARLAANYLRVTSRIFTAFATPAAIESLPAKAADEDAPARVAARTRAKVKN